MKTKIEKHNCLSTIAVKHTANLVIKVTIVIDIAVAKHIIVMFVMFTNTEILRTGSGITVRLGASTAITLLADPAVLTKTHHMSGDT